MRRAHCSHPGKREQTHDSCAQCDTRKTAVSLAPAAENRALCDVFDGRFSQMEHIRPHHSFSYVKDCYNVQQLCALTPALKITVTARFRRKIFRSETDKKRTTKVYWIQQTLSSCRPAWQEKKINRRDCEKKKKKLLFLTYRNLFKMNGVFNVSQQHVEPLAYSHARGKRGHVCTQDDFRCKKYWGRLSVSQTLTLTLPIWAQV